MKRLSSPFAAKVATGHCPKTSNLSNLGRFLPLCLALFVLYLLVPASALHAQTACWPAWSASTVYLGGAQVSENGENYQADYWTQGNNPATAGNSGPLGTGDFWIPEGSCSGSGGGGGGTNPTPTPTPNSGGGSSGISSGTSYNVINQANSLCVDDAAASTANGTIVQQYTCNSTAAQGWQFIATDSGYYRVLNQNAASENEVWDVTGGASATSVGVKIQTWSYGGGTNQQWLPVSLGGGYYKMVARNSGLCLDVPGSSASSGVQLQQYTCNGTGAQAWRLATAGSGGGGTPPPPPPPGGKVFAPYIDISLSSDENPSGITSSAGLHGVTLAFMTASSCAAGWGGLGGNLPTDNFPNGDTVTNQVNQMHSQGVNVAVSFGGADGVDPSAYCSSASQLQSVFQQVVNQYHPSRMDFDIEGGSQDNHPWNTLRAQALNGLRSANPGLIISYTLPVLNSGLTSDGLTPINDSKSVGFTPDIVNVMTMDFGSCCDNGGAMDQASEGAASSTHNQVGGTIGITPMIGQNDTGGEIFTLQDASNVVNWANGQSYVGLMAFWSLARDNGGCSGQTFASATCSGVSQSTWQFSHTFESF